MTAARGRKRVIVNADDLGFSEGITEGILRAHADGIVTSATIAANMPAAAAAARLAREMPDLGVGVHLNVSQGPPLSPAAAALAGDDGLMRRSAGQVILACLRRPGLIDAMAAEFDAQVRWALDHGLRPTHLDSHRHVHAFPPVFARVAALARRYDIPFVRRHRESLPGVGYPAAPIRQRAVRWLTDLFGAIDVRVAPGLLASQGTWGVAHTGLIDAGWLIRAAAAVRPGVTEIMAHPGLPAGLAASATRLRASRLAELEALCDPAVRKAFESHGIELVHYGKL